MSFDRECDQSSRNHIAILFSVITCLYCCSTVYNVVRCIAICTALWVINFAPSYYYLQTLSSISCRLPSLIAIHYCILLRPKQSSITHTTHCCVTWWAPPWLSLSTGHHGRLELLRGVGMEADNLPVTGRLSLLQQPAWPYSLCYMAWLLDSDGCGPAKVPSEIL